MKPSPQPDPVEQAAAEWALRKERGLSAAEQAELREWLNSDARHGAVLAETEETSRLLSSLRQPAREIPFPVQARATRRGPRWVVLAAAAVLALAFLGWWRFRPEDATVQTASTRIGEQRTLALADGSVVLLNTDSAVRVVYRSAERRVELLRGEAFFTVAKNPARPFWVRSGGIAVRAVGTAFNVRINDQGLNVLVTEGKVQAFAVQNHASPLAQDAVRLGPIFTMGHLAQVSARRAGDDEKAVVVTAVDQRVLDDALAWKQGRLEFVQTPLSEVVSEFNRYNRRRMVIVDPKLAGRRFGGSFASPNVDALIELLQQEFGVAAEDRGEKIELRLRQ